MKKYASYIVLGKTPEGKIIGYTEHSFAMGLSDNRVRVERSYEWRYSAKKKGVSEKLLAYRGVKEWADKLNNKDLNGIIYKPFRIGSKNCPVIIDWREIVEMKKTNKNDKFNWRNLPFRVKENVEF